ARAESDHRGSVGVWLVRAQRPAAWPSLAAENGRPALPPAAATRRSRSRPGFRGWPAPRPGLVRPTQVGPEPDKLRPESPGIARINSPAPAFGPLASRPAGRFRPGASGPAR